MAKPVSGWVRALPARVHVPACLVAGVGAGLIGLGWLTGFGGVDARAAVGDLRVVVLGPVSLAFIGLFLVTERVRPAQQRSLVARGHRHDLLYAALSAAVVIPFTAVLGLSFATLVPRALPWIVLPESGRVPRWLVMVVLLVAMDGCNWLVHLANHRNGVLWRFHELHHSQEDMNVLTVFRTHPLIHVSYLVALLPAIVLIANGALSSLILVLYGATVAFAHSNTNLGFGPLERIVVSPNFHRQHHRLVGRQDINLGFALTIWDQLAGLAVFPTPETIGIDTGLPGRPLAVEQAGDRPHHLRVLAAQLVGPFRPAEPPSGHPVATATGGPDTAGADLAAAADAAAAISSAPDTAGADAAGSGRGEPSMGAGATTGIGGAGVRGGDDERRTNESEAAA